MSETGKPGRYPRSANGLVAALVITVVAVTGTVVFRGLLSSDLEVGPEPVDYLEVVEQLQQADVPVVYPATLPEGWIVSNVDVEPGESPAFGLSLFTAGEAFVGLQQEDEPLDDLLELYLDSDEVEQEAAYDASGSVAPRWEGYSEPDGDLAYAAEVGDDTVLVYGSADAEELQSVIERLTDEPAPTASPSPPTR